MTNRQPEMHFASNGSVLPSVPRFCLRNTRLHSPDHVEYREQTLGPDP